MTENDPVLQAIGLIKNEHRAQRSVQAALRVLSGRAIRSKTSPDFPALWSIIEYIDRFADRLHHPKEELHVFRVLERRHPGASAMIRRLRRDHAANGGYTVRLAEGLRDWQRGNASGGTLFVNAARDLSQFNWRHTSYEERVVLPAARSSFTESDWKDVSTAFMANDDPLVRSRSRVECAAALKQLTPQRAA
jgi:hemerythrin-like domain-containing protein